MMVTLSMNFSLKFISTSGVQVFIPPIGGIFILYLSIMKKGFFNTLAKINKAVLPSFTKRQLDLTKASKWQLAIFGYRLWVTKNALD